MSWTCSQLAVQRSDGTQLTGNFNRQIGIQVTHESDTTSLNTSPEQLVVVPDDSVVTYQVTPEPGDRHIIVRVSVQSVIHVIVTCAVQPETKLTFLVARQMN